MAGQFAFFGGQILMYQALIDAQRGELDAALATFANGRAGFRANGGRTGIATCQALLAEQLARSGRISDAAAHVAAARQDIIDTGEGTNELPVRIAEGVLAHAQGDTDLARQHFITAIRAGR
ncbi:MAG: hypothetical protein ACKV2O_23735 [Acidimicrobiales bacterium]